MASAAIELKLQRPHAAQQHMLEKREKYNIARCGRRFGKTEMGKKLLTEAGKVLHGQPCAWFAPKGKYMAKVWREIINDLAPVIVRSNATERIIEFIGGGELEFWTLEDVDAGKSRKYKLAIIDEAELAKDLKYSWEQAIQPTLLDLDGEAWFFSTPKGFTYFNELWERGQSNDEIDRHYASWCFTTYDNPTIPHVKEYLEQKKKELPDLVFRQEFLAEVVDFGGNLIEREWIRYGLPKQGEIISTAIGVDLAISMRDDAAYTAFVVMQNDKYGNEYVVDALKQRLKFHSIVSMLTECAIRWQPHIINIEEVQFQAAVVQEMLRKTKFNIKGCKPDRTQDKLTRFLPLQPRYREGIIYHSPDLPSFFDKDILGFPSSGDLDVPDAMVYAHMGLRPLIAGAYLQGVSREVPQQLKTTVNISNGTWGTVSES